MVWHHGLFDFNTVVYPANRGITLLVVNLLFWLQLAALLGSVLALARPQLIRPGSQTTLVILDTSASMAAGARELLRQAGTVLGDPPPLCHQTLTDVNDGVPQTSEDTANERNLLG